MPITLRLALRNLLRHPWRSLVTILGVATGIASVLATLSLGDNVRANLSELLQAASGQAGLVISPGVDGRAVFDYGEARLAAEDDPGVRLAYPVLRHRAEPVRDLELEGDGRLQVVDSGFQLSGFPMEYGPDLPLVVSSGRLPGPAGMEIALAEGFAVSRGLAGGDTVSFATQIGDAEFTVSGLLDDAEGYGSTNFGRVGAVELTDLQDVLRLVAAPASSS